LLSFCKGTELFWISRILVLSFLGNVRQFGTNREQKKEIETLENFRTTVFIITERENECSDEIRNVYRNVLQHRQ
jgi:hypothetical protein